MNDVQRILPKCPKCGRYYSEHPAISRVDNKTEICGACGMREATDVWIEYLYNEMKDSYNQNFSEK